MTCYHRHWTNYTINRCRALHVIIYLGQHTQGWMTSAVAYHHCPWKKHTYDIGNTCHHFPWEAHTVRVRQAWHAIFTLESTCLDDVGLVMTSSPLENTHCRKTLMWHVIMPMYFKHVQTASGIARHHLPSTTHMVGLHEAWHAIITIRKNTLSDDIGRGMPLSPLGKIHGRTTSVVARHHLPWIAYRVERHQCDMS